MGLLDALFPDDPQKAAQVAMAFGLLGGAPGQRRNFGADIQNAGLLGMNTFAQGKQAQLIQQKAERENRASDLQQATGAYNLLKQQEFSKMLEQGDSYVPHPMIPQLESKIAELTGLKNLSGQTGVPQGPPAPPPQSTLPAPIASQYSSAVRPEWQASGPMPQASPQTSKSGIGGPAGGIAMKVWLAQDPTGASYIKQLAEDNKPVALRQGDLVKRNPDGSYSSAFQQPQMDKGILPQRDASGQVTGAATIPGYLPAIADLKSAEVGAAQAAEFPYRVTEVTDATGARRPSLLSKAVGQPQAPQFGAPDVRPVVPGSGLSRPQQQPAQQPAQQNDPWSSLPKRVIPTGSGQTTFDKSMDENYAKAAFDLSQKYGTNADLANQRKALNSQALDLVERADTGPMAVRIADVKNFLVSRVGIPESSFDNTPSATIALNKDLINSAVSRAKQMYGARMTQSEAMMQIQRAAPNADMPKAAIKFLLNSDNALADYQIGQSNDFGRYISSQGDPSRFEGWYAQRFPMGRALESVKLGDQKQAPQADPLVVTAPDGKAHRFPSAQAAQAFRKMIGQ